MSFASQLSPPNRNTIRGRTDYDMFPRDFADVPCANDREVAQSDKPIEFEEVVPQDDGVHTYISIKFPLHDVHGFSEAICGISTDITERRHDEERLRHLAQRLVTVREEERQRLGFDLHDGVCQELIGMEQRALALHGKLEVRSTPGAGTTVHLTCPLRGA